MGGGMLPGNRDILYFLPCSNGNRTPLRQRPAARSVSSGMACPARLSFAAAGPNIHAPALLWSAPIMRLATLSAFVLAAGLTAPHAIAAEDAAKTLHGLFDAGWERSLRENPFFATYLGDPRYDDQVPDVSLAAIDASNEADRADARRRRSDSGGEPDTGGPAQPRALPSHVCRCDRRPRVGNPVPPAQSHGRHTEPRPDHAAPAVRDGEGLRELARTHGQVQQAHGPEHRADARRHCEEDGPAARDHGARAATDRHAAGRRSHSEPVLRSFQDHARLDPGCRADTAARRRVAGDQQGDRAGVPALRRFLPQGVPARFPRHRGCPRSPGRRGVVSATHPLVHNHRPDRRPDPRARTVARWRESAARCRR